MAELTRREQFAMAAMQGYIAEGVFSIANCVDMAVKCADALIEALDDQGWIKWQGGDCPVAPGVFVDIKFRGGGGGQERRAISWDWSHHDHPGDIVEYRLVKGEQK